LSGTSFKCDNPLKDLEITEQYWNPQTVFREYENLCGIQAQQGKYAVI